MTDVLVVEDNMELAQLIQAFLTREGFSHYHMVSSEDALEWLKLHHSQIILLDIMLPGMDGFAFCQTIRTQCQTPILMMSARSTKSDQLMGFELGADDYLEKPVDPDILCAKIRAVLARNPSQKTSHIIISGELKIDTDARQVYLKENLLNLSVKEYELLLIFVQNPGKTLHKDFLFNEIWGNDSMSENQTLTVHVKMLRTHIEDNSKHPKRIQTVWGIGYRYEEI